MQIICAHIQIKRHRNFFPEVVGSACFVFSWIEDLLYSYKYVVLKCRILGLPAVMGDVEWKIEQTQFLLHKGFFYPSSREQDFPPIGGLLAGMLHASISVRITI